MAQSPSPVVRIVVRLAHERKPRLSGAFPVDENLPYSGFRKG